MLYRTRKDFTATHTDCCTGSLGFLTCSMCYHHTISNSLHMSTSIMVQISQAISVACSCWLSWCGNRLSRRQSHQLGQNHRNAPLHIRLRHSIPASPSGAASDCHHCDYHFLPIRSLLLRAEDPFYKVVCVSLPLCLCTHDSSCQCPLCISGIQHKLFHHKKCCDC